MPAYLFWSLVYLLLDAAAGTPHARPLRDLATGGAYMHLYYIFVLVQLLVLSDPLQRAVRRCPWGTLAAAAAVSLAMQAALCAQAMGRLTLLSLPVPPALCFVPWLVFYVGGAVLRHQIERGRVLSLRCGAGLSLVGAAAVLWTAKRVPAVRALSLRPDVTLYTFALFLLLWALFSRMGGVPRPLRAVSRLSFALYLSHPLVLRLWNEWTIRREPVIYLKLWQSYLMTAFGGLLIACVLSRLPFGTLLGGAPRHDKTITEGQNGKKNRDKTI